MISINNAKSLSYNVCYNMNVIFLLLGSNLGNRKHFLDEAIRLIATEIGSVTNRSSIYETQSWGKTDLPDYLNQVIVVETNFAARQVLSGVLDIEKRLGRTREEKWGSRTIDIDILFFNNEVMNEPDLQVPHPQLHKRGFTLTPLAEIAPDFVHPVLNQNISKLRDNLDDNLQIKNYI